MIKVNPVWGDVQPTKVIGYKIVVVPHRYTEACWEFLILLPTGDEESEDLSSIREICDNVLENKDGYSIFHLNSDENNAYKEMPVAWLGVFEDEPQWLTPPIHLQH